jgi:putative transposon-encoded protein
MATPTEVKVTGYATFNRTVRIGGNSGRVNVPPELVGRRVVVILLDDPDTPLPTSPDAPA